MSNDDLPGIKLLKIGTTKLPSETQPVLLFSGELILSTASSKLAQINLESHETTSSSDGRKLREIFDKQLLCQR